MPGKTCSICRKTWAAEGIRMYTAPSDPDHRELWNEMCGILLKNSSRICEVHFLDSDFRVANQKRFLKRRRLHANSVPSQYLQGCSDPEAVRKCAERSTAIYNEGMAAMETAKSAKDEDDECYRDDSAACIIQTEPVDFVEIDMEYQSLDATQEIIECVALDEPIIEKPKRVFSQRPKSVCEQCGKEFDWPFLLRRHSVYHDPPQYKCDSCERRFYLEEQLIQHRKIHSNQRDFVCEECGKAFLRHRELTDHKITYHSDQRREYICNICNHKVTSRSGLICHRKTAHLVLEGTIEELSQPIKSGKSKIKYTMDPVTNEKRYQCEHCGNTYKYSKGLRVHKINVHGYVSKPRKKIDEIETDNSDIHIIINSSTASRIINLKKKC